MSKDGCREDSVSAWGMKHETRRLNPRNFFRAHTNAMINDETIDRNRTSLKTKVSWLQSAKLVENATTKGF